MTKKLLVVDGNSILNRAFYGIRLLTNREGLFTNAIYGMINIISKQVEKLDPDYCAVAFDLKAPTFRHLMYDGYKANRKGMPEELAVQLPYAKECMTALGYHVVSKEGFEADDILGTLSSMAKVKGIKSYILTGDRDSLQLIDDDTTVLLVKTKDTVNFDTQEFINNYGILPSQFVDVKALMGDSSDNIPGVAGIGEKTALKLIADFKDLDSLYATFEASSLSPSVKNKLSAGRESAYMSRDLARIKTDTPMDSEIDDYQYSGIDKAHLRELFVKLDFNALIQRFGLDEKEEELMTEGSVACANEALELSIDELNDKLNRDEITVALDAEKLYIFDGENVYYIDFKQNQEILPSKLKDKSVICYDFKNIFKALREAEIESPKCHFDVMLAAYVLDATMPSFSLERLCDTFGVRYDHNFGGVISTSKLYEMLRQKISDEGAGRLLYEIEIPLAEILAEMELFGFKIDTKGILNYGEELKEMAEALQSRIYVYAGEEFNISSPKQLGEVLFEKMGLPKSKKTKTGYSTDAETLNKMIAYHPIIEDILDYRQVTKLKSTYADGLAKAADTRGRVHSVFNQTGTATGRLSSSEPNLQNIPIKTEAGRKFRKYFIPENQDYLFIDADYSQIELRILAHVSNDETMINAFVNGEDIHTTTAAKVFGVTPSEVTPELRKRAKAVNFGIVYGIGEYSLSEDLGISRTQAKQYIESYFEKFPNVYSYLQQIKEKARKDGYVVTELGRKRMIPEISSSNKNLQHFGERVAMNSPIQGAAADIIKLAMVNVTKELKARGIDARLILQVHDELLIETHKECAEEAMKVLVEGMENAVKLSVPLRVDANKGENWYEAK